MRVANDSNDYVIRVFERPDQVDAQQWNALLELQPSSTPFMRHEYLSALHESGSAVSATGWTAQFVAIYEKDHDEEVLVGAAPLYLKDHSYGEYVFDWAWAAAHERHGLAYYPKLLAAVPFTPVAGPRLMARSDALRSALLQTVKRLGQEAALSSAHWLFLDQADQRAAREAGWMMRSTVQFHWYNRCPHSYADFAEFLASLQRDKRKKVAQERRKVREAGVTFRTMAGQDIAPEDWDFFYRCYTLNYRAHHSTPYLTRSFFARMAATMAEQWLLFIAERGGRRVAASLIAIDPPRGHAFGRYWGAIEQVDCLHFEACYYQPLAWCIAHGYRRFEGGAQGEHKMARGLLPVVTASAHWLAQPQFANAVADYLHKEGLAIEGYVDELNERQPFKLVTRTEGA